MVDFNKIKELRDEINRLIDENPSLRELQDLIDSELSLCGNDTQRRNAKMQELMMNKWSEIVPKTEELVVAYEEFNKPTKIKVIEDK